MCPLLSTLAQFLTGFDFSGSPSFTAVSEPQTQTNASRVFRLMFQCVPLKAPHPHPIFFFCSCVHASFYRQQVTYFFPVPPSGCSSYPQSAPLCRLSAFLLLTLSRWSAFFHAFSGNAKTFSACHGFFKRRVTRVCSELQSEDVFTERNRWKCPLNTEHRGNMFTAPAGFDFIRNFGISIFSSFLGKSQGLFFFWQTPSWIGRKAASEIAFAHSLWQQTWTN